MANSLLPVTQRCNNIIFPSNANSCKQPFYVSASQDSITSPVTDEYDNEKLLPLYVHPDDLMPIGVIRPIVLEYLLKNNHDRLANNQQTLFKFVQSIHNGLIVNYDSPLPDNILYVTFQDWLIGSNGPCPLISQELAKLCSDWRDNKIFSSMLDGWRNELYPIYRMTSDSGTHLCFDIERSAACLFGFPTFGVHLTASVPDPKDNSKTKVWVAQRSYNKPTYPGMLDNSVAGGIASGEKPFECVVRECAEEASLDEETVLRHIKSAGIVSYNFRHDLGWIQPELQYVYDLALPKSVKFAPMDGEVHDFKLCTIPQVLKQLKNFEYKPNCALVLIDWLIRNGHVKAESTPDYLKICCAIHTPLCFPVPVNLDK